MQVLCNDGEIIKTIRDFLSQRHIPWYNCLVVISFVTVFVFSVSTSKYDANMKMSPIEETGNLKDIKHHCDWQSVFMVFLFIYCLSFCYPRDSGTHTEKQPFQFYTWYRNIYSCFCCCRISLIKNWKRQRRKMTFLFDLEVYSISNGIEIQSTSSHPMPDDISDLPPSVGQSWPMYPQDFPSQDMSVHSGLCHVPVDFFKFPDISSPWKQRLTRCRDDGTNNVVYSWYSIIGGGWPPGLKIWMSEKLAGYQADEMYKHISIFAMETLYGNASKKRTVDLW